MTAFACIYVPDFPVEAVLRMEPELGSQTVVVLEGKAPLQKVFGVNENARRAGVRPGMTKIQVEAGADIIIFRPRSSLQEAAAQAALLDCAQSFSPRVEDGGPGMVSLDLAGMEPLFGPIPKIARDIARRASVLGLEANVAVASNPDAAKLAARGFPGITVISRGKEAEQLGRLPVEVLFSCSALDAGRQADDRQVEFLEIFRRWGVHNLHALAELPDVALSERLGQEGLRLQQLARGAASSTLVPVEPSLVFEEAIELEYPLVLLEPLAFLLGRLLEQLCARLDAHALATQELRLKLELENGFHCGDEETTAVLDSAESSTDGRGRPSQRDPTPRDLEQSSKRLFQRTLRLPVPLLDPKVFLKLLQLDLKAHPPGAPIVKIHLAVEPVRPRAAQGGLFLPPMPEPEKLELTLARIAAIVGEGKTGAVELLDTHRPEGFRLQRFAPSEPQMRKSRSSQKPAEETPDLVTALRLLRPPARATITLRDGKPVHLACSRRRQVQEGEILWTAGPWRASGDWWEHQGWARDEWDIAVQGECGVALYRLVRNLLNGEWMVEGTYD